MNRLPDLPLLLADVPLGLRHALAQEGVPAAALRGGRAGKFVLFDSIRGRPMLANGQVAIDVNLLRAQASGDPMAELSDERCACQEWQIGGLAVRETVARRHRASARRRVIEFVRAQVEAAGGIWLRVWPYPAPYRSAFNIRLDHDDFDRNDFDATLEAIAGYEHATSHYVCAASHVEHREAMRRLRGFHVGSHGWRHHTYGDAPDNLMNIGRGIDALRAAGLEPIGFVAPHGRFNAGLLTAIEDLGVTHSSEFALAYDDLPFFPRERNVLQIPVHPICLGVCLEAARRMPEGGALSPFAPRKGALSRSERRHWPRLLLNPADDAAAEILIEHWRQVASRKHAAGEPMFFYGHPDGRLGRYPHVLRELLGHVSRLPEVWYATLADVEQWWRQRAAIEITAAHTDKGIEIHSLGLPSAHRARLELFRGTEVAQIDLDRPRQTTHAGELHWQPRHELFAGEIPPTERSEGWRAGLRRYLDWERVTPIDEIGVRTWRGRIKKTLRRVKS